MDTDKRSQVSELEPYCGECGAKVSVSLESEWIVRYAEILGCDPRASAVAVAIEELMGEVERVRRSIKRHRENAYKLGKREQSELFEQSW